MRYFILLMSLFIAQLLPTTVAAEQWCVSYATNSQYNRSGGHVVWFSRLEFSKQRFIFMESDKGKIVTNDDGTAHFTGTIYDKNRPDRRFKIDVTLTGRTAVGEHPSLGRGAKSPKKELNRKAYTNKGGPVDVNTWFYYKNFTGTFTGEGTYAGAVVNVQRMGPAFQIGKGANGKNAGFGASGWINYTIVKHPDNGIRFAKRQADFNLNLKECAQQCQLMYAVNDRGLNNTQFFTIDTLNNYEVTALGNEYPEHDIESLDMSPDGVLYASSGDDPTGGAPVGHLYRVDKVTGALTSVGDIVDATTGESYGEISALSFRSNGSLWGWAEGKGVIKINPETAKATMQLATDAAVEGMSWSFDGSVLYGVENQILWGYHPATNSVAMICPEIGMTQVEAIEGNIADGSLLFAFHGNDFKIHSFDPAVCLVTETMNIDTPYDDIEGITWGCEMK